MRGEVAVLKCPASQGARPWASSANQERRESMSIVIRIEQSDKGLTLAVDPPTTPVATTYGILAAVEAITRFRLLQGSQAKVKKTMKKAKP